MDHWMCSECNYIYETDSPHESCPGCGVRCEVFNISCYIPECGGQGHLDERLVIEKVKQAKKGQP
ncbi:rubredoxin-like domain-containing protein [Chloroflexota bacterium]